jgi:hypothetical protein
VLRVKARAHRDLITIVGHAATIAAGEWITALGEWITTGPTDSSLAGCEFQAPQKCLKLIKVYAINFIP